MYEIERQKRRRRTALLIGSLMVLSLAMLIVLQSSNLWKSFAIESSADLLVLYALSSLNFIAFVVFAFIFLRSLVRLIHERRTFQLGAKIKTRLLVYFATLSLLPIFAMAVFSYLFLNRALERWFSQIPQNVIQQARDMQRSAVDEHAASLTAAARMLSTTLEGQDLTSTALARVAAAGGLTHIEVFAADGKTLVQSERRVEPEQRAELDAIIAAARAGRTDARFSDRQGLDAAVAEMSGGRRLLIVPDPVTEKNVGQVVENSVAELNRLSEQQVTVRRVGLLTLGVLTFLLLFASSWIAFYLARGLTEPIRALAEGAGEIADGNLGHQVDVIAEDELGILVAAFNEMSARLQANSAELTARRRYIETVLETLPSGVVSLDDEMRITTVNSAAVNILGVDQAARGIELPSVVSEPHLSKIVRLIARAKRTGTGSDQIEIARSGGDSGEPIDLTISITAAKLPGDGGVVLVIEDLSQLISGQRASAWQEVARRMAHEIKNPLTPIQLSAERIRRRFEKSGHTDTGSGKRINDKGPITDVVQESTATILREVSSLKSMVDEFSRFARLPEAKLADVDLSRIVGEAVATSAAGFPEVNFTTNLPPDLPQISGDAEQLKRVFTNLLDNAAEACDEARAGRSVSVMARHDPARDIVVAEVTDNGRGLDPGNLQKLFQPYFSTKGRGTGLGLAIVNRIIADHKGRIHAAQNSPRGAKFIIELPVAS